MPQAQSSAATENERGGRQDEQTVFDQLVANEDCAIATATVELDRSEGMAVERRIRQRPPQHYGRKGN
jgi:hypothetical protein